MVYLFQYYNIMITRLSLSEVKSIGVERHSAPPTKIGICSRDIVCVLRQCHGTGVVQAPGDGYNIAVQASLVGCAP